ncbi:MAG: glycosyltransferase family 4 protein [Alphaproteobacteria bacterium]
MAKSILVDGYNLALEKGTGVATYARNLSFMLHEIGARVEILYGARISSSRDSLLREISFFDPRPKTEQYWHEIVRYVAKAFAAPVGSTAREVPVTGDVIATPFRSRLPHFDRIWNVPELFTLGRNGFRAWGKPLTVTVPSRPSIAHWTYPLPLKVAGAKNIYTLHDLIPLRLPYTTLDNKSYYLRLMKSLVRDADHIVTVSENSKRDIVNLLGASPDKITNTFQAVEIPAALATRPIDAVTREIKGIFGLEYGAYFLYFGALEPKKNVGRLIEAYLAAGIDTPLVIVAAEGWKSDQELRLLNEDHIRYERSIGDLTLVRRKVMRFEYAPFPVLVSLIRGAKAVLFPSLYEGFGLPVLEAMQLETPVLTSDQGSLPEVAGDAALIVDPYNVRKMAEGIRELDGNGELRGNLRARGLKQVENFTTERYKARLQEMYRRIDP